MHILSTLIPKRETKQWAICSIDMRKVLQPFSLPFPSPPRFTLTSLALARHTLPVSLISPRPAPCLHTAVMLLRCAVLMVLAVAISAGNLTGHR